jgi:hypothetical protein
MEEEEQTNVPFTLQRRVAEPLPAAEPVLEEAPASEPVPFTLRRPEPAAVEPEVQPLRLSRTPQEPLPSTRVVPIGTDFINLDAILEEYNRPLIKEDFLEDERLQELVIQSLEARREGTTAVGRGVTGIAGGATFAGAQNYREMPFEDVFETWQNYQRSFAVGQSVTVGNEIAYSLSQDEDTMAKLGAGYLLFGSMDNVFTGEGTWREMGDAILDYARGVVWDPTTLATLGIGRALSAGATRASAAAARNVMIRAYRRSLSRGATGRAAIAAVGASAAAAPYIAPDLALNVGIDILQQGQLIRTDAQEEYSGAQTALAAAGTMAIPAIMLGMKGAGALRRGALRDTWLGATDTAYLERTMTDVQAWEATAQRVDRSQLINFSDDTFGRLEGDPNLFLDWADAKVVAGDLVNERGERLNDNDVMNLFERYFWFGDPGEETKGYFLTLKDAGFVIHPSMMENNTISGVYGQAITLMSDEAAEKVVKGFEQASGRQLGITPTADGLAAHFINRSRQLGEGLGIRAQLSRWERQGLSGRELLEATAGRNAQADDPQVGQFAVSIYKRLLTSHLATTGANLKGFAQLVQIDTYADIFSASVYATQSAFYKNIRGDTEAATRFANQAWASLYAPARRAAGVLSPDLDLDYATRVLEMNPEAMERLFREISGDSGPTQALSQYNLEGSRVARGADAVARGTQTLTLVTLQDNLTKRWAFASNLDREIMRNYGVTAQSFWARQDSALEMHSDTFQAALDRAVFRTQRQTASVNWTTLPGRDGMRWAAKSFEDGINRNFGGALGFVVPFPAFMNTTVATLGDLSGVNALRRLYGASRGRPMDYADQDFGELMGKAIAGWAIVGAGVPAAVERIQEGYSWSQDVDTRTGGIEDRTFDWPGSTIRLASQMIAHSIVGENISSDPNELAAQISRGEVTFDLAQVPADLIREFGIQAGPGQALRDFDGSLQTVRETLNTALENPEEMGEAFTDLAISLLTKPIQGALRPLDPINMAVGLARDGNMNPDLRQGPEQLNQAFRYINQLLPEVSGVDDLPRRATPLRGTDQNVDLGRQILGNRMSRTPNVAEAMFNSAGIPSWRSVRWDGPPEVRNFMDGLAAPIFEREAIRAIRDNPDYFEMTTQEKEIILGDIRGRVRSQVMDIMETRGTPRTLNAARKLSGANQARVREVINFLGYEGDLSDILAQEDGFEALSRIQYFVDNYDQIFHGELKLGR